MDIKRNFPKYHPLKNHFTKRGRLIFLWPTSLNLETGKPHVNKWFFYDHIYKIHIFARNTTQPNRLSEKTLDTYKMTNGTVGESNSNMSAVSDRESRQDLSRSGTPSDVNIAMRCALKGSVDRFVKSFEDEEDQFFDKVADMLMERDEEGKTPLDMAALLGRVGMVRELITRGAEINAATSNGKYCIHLYHLIL